ncbi:MAG TPA: hypothetical protein PKH65_07260 [Bacteroidia bacterium]|nr:hypothetical protein [Bacteroidia bacterium]HNT80466.1 hypothetical protein [Bacteroidia bacterium]
MNKERFLELLKNPVDIPTSEINQLKELVQQFPYFNSARILYAKSLKDSNNLLYDAELRKAAIYSNDRKVLHDYMQKKVIDNKELPAFTSELLEEAQQAEEVIIEQPTELNEPIQAAPIDSDTDEQKSDLQKIIASRLSELSKEESAGTLESKTIEATTEPEIQSAELDDESHTVESLNEVEPVIDVETQFEEIKETHVSIDIQDKRSFVEWLRFVKAGLHIHIVNESKEEELIKEQEQKPVKSNTEKLQNENDEIISKFIQSNPRIDPAKSKFYSPVDMARNSIVENEEIVSETLAGIYAQQGNMAKAVRSYEILSLKYPEKKAYFAGLILQLKKQ